MRVCLFGAYDREYPRVRMFREGLLQAGIEIVEAHAPERRMWRRYPALTRAFHRFGESSDAIVVPAFRHKDVPLARALAGRRPLIFDPLVSRHDTLVNDWSLHREGSAQARWNRGIDRWSLRLSDWVLCDTWSHGRLFEGLGAPRARLRRVLVGAEAPFFAVADRNFEGPVRVVYVGGFLPLHGVTVVIEAAVLLEREFHRLPPFAIELWGRGIEFERARALAARAGVRCVSFQGPCDYSQAPHRFADADVVLGAFGGSEKAGRVIPHKVFQGVAAGRAVVTGDGCGVREVFEPGVHLMLVPRGDARSLAESLAGLIRDPKCRAALASRGRARALEVATPERIGAELVQVLEEALR